MLKRALGVCAGLFALTCGLGVGAAHAETPTSTAEAQNQVTVSVQQILQDLPHQLADTIADASSPQRTAPSAHDVLAFLQESLTLAGRDILAERHAPETWTTATTLSVLDKDTTPVTPAPKPIADLGEDIDGMWSVVATEVSRIPVLGEMVFGVIEGMRHSRYWKNDYYRLMRTASIFVALSSLVIGPIVGLAAAIVISFTLVMPITIVLLSGAVVFAILALPFAFLSGLAIMGLSFMTWLLGTAAGIGIIVLGALLISGVLDFLASAAAIASIPFIGGAIAAGITVAMKILGVILIMVGAGVLILSGLALIGVIVGALLVVAPWFAIAGFFLLAAIVFLAAFLISALLVLPIAMVTTPLAMLPILFFALGIFLFGLFLYGVTGHTNEGPQNTAINRSEEQRNNQLAADNGSKKNKDKKSKKDKNGKDGNAKKNGKASKDEKKGKGKANKADKASKNKKPHKGNKNKKTAATHAPSVRSQSHYGLAA